VTRPSRASRRPAPAAAGRVDQTTPWRIEDAARLARFEIPSLIAIVVCFVGAKRTDTWDNQLYWIAGAMAAMLLAGAGWTEWLLVGTRALRRRQRRLAEVTSGLTVARRPDVVTDVLVTGPKMTHFHRTDCPLVRGRAASTGSSEDFEARGLTPCGVCLDSASAPRHGVTG
jgi:hypothetical protein